MLPNKIGKVALSLILTVLLILPAGMVGAVTTEVSLLNATVTKVYTTPSYIIFKGQIEVQNIAYQKQVEVFSANGTKLATAYYVGPSVSGYENWEFSANLSGVTGVTFYIKYQVNGQTYYDNNNGNDYSISTDPLSGVSRIMLAKSNLITEAQASSSTQISGEVTLKNLAYQKTVTVVYTTNNWATSSSVSASFGTPHFNYEKWFFTISGLSSGQTVKYYVDYYVNGTHYYDNNLNRDYSITMP